MHWGSATRGVTFDEKEHIAFVRRYPGYADPYLNPHLALSDGRIARAAPTRRARTARRSPPRCSCVTHNLNLEGAPLFLLEYATYMAQGSRLQPRGARRPGRAAARRLRGAGRPDHGRSTPAPLYASPDEEIFHDALGRHQADSSICAAIDLRRLQHPDEFLGRASRVGRGQAFPLLHPREHLGLPLLLAEARAQPAPARRVRPSSQPPARSFLCAATQDYYQDFNRNGNFRIVPSWIRLDDIEEFRAHPSPRRTPPQTRFRATTRSSSRTSAPSANARASTSSCGRWTILTITSATTGNSASFSSAPARAFTSTCCMRDLARLGLANVTLVPETREVFDFFVAADLFVCSSYEESFPRVVMEAMAFRTPIVTTDVHGIADMIGERQRGLPGRARRPLALSKMMWTCLAKERSGKSLTPTAFSKALRYYDSTACCPAMSSWRARRGWRTLNPPKPRRNSGFGTENCLTLKAGADSVNGPPPPAGRPRKPRRPLVGSAPPVQPNFR